MNFDQAFERLIGHEGGYCNDKADPGGETKYGICRRSYPTEDIAGLTLDRAKVLYKRDYWTPAGIDLVPDAIRFDLFDMAVSSGVGTAIKTLQKAVGAEPDGLLGPLTRKAIETMPAAQLLARFNGHRLALLADLTTWPSFSRGWARRIAANLMSA